MKILMIQCANHQPSRPVTVCVHLLDNRGLGVVDRNDGGFRVVLCPHCFEVHELLGFEAIEQELTMICATCADEVIANNKDKE